MKQLLPDKIKINTEKRKPLNYIAAIKFLAMIKIIKWHVIVWKEKPIDWGARMCEILFIASGFLVGYNHYQRNMQSDYTTSFKYSNFCLSAICSKSNKKELLKAKYFASLFS